MHFYTTATIEICYYRDIYEGKYLLAVAETKQKSMLLTGYITDRIKKGDLVWKKD